MRICADERRTEPRNHTRYNNGSSYARWHARARARNELHAHARTQRAYARTGCVLGECGENGFFSKKSPQKKRRIYFLPQ